MRTPTNEPIQESRLLPRISFRTLFVFTAVSAVIIAVARQSGNGNVVAIALVIALGFIAACLLVFVALFLFAWVLSLGAPGEPEDYASGSPFSEGQLPPQILPPRDPQL